LAKGASDDAHELAEFAVSRQGFRMDMTYPHLSGAAWRQIVLWSIFLTLIGCKSTKIESSWVSQPMRIDGSVGDWHDRPLAFFEKERLSVGIANDSTNLYLLLRTNNLAFIRGIRQEGITLWLDSKGGKDKKRAIFYQGGPDRTEMEKAGLSERPANTERTGDRRFEGRMPTIDSMPRERFSFIDENYYLEKNINPDGLYGPEVAVGVEGGFCIYELRIPLTDAPPEISGQNVSLGVQWQEMDTSKFQGRPPGGRGGFPGGGGGFPGGRFMQDDVPFGGGGGGMRPGGMRGGPGEGPQTDERNIWIKIQLALPPA